jgi:hypothetical protein
VSIVGVVLSVGIQVIGMAATDLDQLSGRRPLARRPVSAGESTTEAVLEAFEAVATDPDEGSLLYEQIEPDALDALLDDAPADPTVMIELWGHPVLITGNWVAVYRQDAD